MLRATLHPHTQSTVLIISCPLSFAPGSDGARIVVVVIDIGVGVDDADVGSSFNFVVMVVNTFVPILTWNFARGSFPVLFSLWLRLRSEIVVSLFRA